VAFCIAVIAVSAWQCCSGVAKLSSLQFRGLALIARSPPDVIAPATFAAPSLDQQLVPAQENIAQRAAGQQQINLVQGRVCPGADCRRF
jgi:hypothetical protein